MHPLLLGWGPTGDASPMHVGIVGLGSVGQALARALGASSTSAATSQSATTAWASDMTGRAASGVRLVAVSSRRPKVAMELAGELTGVCAVSTHALAAHVDLVVLSAGDRELYARADDAAWRTGVTVVHTSGALDLTPLEAAAARGARVGSFHPMVSLPSALAVASGDQAERFEETLAAIDGSAVVRAQLNELAAALGMTTVIVDAQWRTRWHAAATLVGNASAALAALAEDMIAQLPVSTRLRRDALAGLLGSVARNLRQLPESAPARAVLSGPIVRGDLATVARHVQAFVSPPPDAGHLSLAAYRQAAALVLLATGDTLSEETRRALTALLSTSTTP